MIDPIIIGVCIGVLTDRLLAALAPLVLHVFRE
jgi:F0F1-type ATP synthase assembly protein I